MPIENSELNTSPALKASHEGFKGGTGDGNRFTIEQLEKGFTPVTPASAMGEAQRSIAMLGLAWPTLD